MDLKNLEDFINLAKKEGVKELKYESKEFKATVVFPFSENLQSQPTAPNLQKTQNLNVGTVDSSSKATSNYHEITSPFVGTFYLSPSPGEPAFVNTGEKVKKGQTLCILEAMKIMNEIESDINGEIVEVCVDNEGLVEFGEVLFKIKAD